MERVYHYKLVRDGIPEKIKASGGECEVRIMEQEEFEQELKQKLTEEAGELEKAKTEDLPEELADLLEILKSLAEHYGIRWQVVEEAQVAKRAKRGSFKKRLFLIWSTPEEK